MPDIFTANPVPPVSPKQKKVIHEKDRKVLSSLRYYPDQLNIPNMLEGEEVVLLLRRHFITNLRWIILAVLALFAPVIIKLFPNLSFIPAGFQFVLVAGWYVMITAFVFEEFLAWFFNVYIVTNDRIICVSFTNLIYKEIVEADLQQIQDVKYVVGGVLRTLAGYGDVIIQTAAENQGLIFGAVPQPDYVAKIIRELREAGEH